MAHSSRRSALRVRIATVAVGAVCALLLAGCPALNEEGEHPGPAVPPLDDLLPDEETAVPGQPVDIAVGLDVPWGLGFLPDGSALVTERDTATIARVRPDGAVTAEGRVDGVETTPGGEGGLLGLAVAPDFPEDSYVYVYFTTAQDNRIVRMAYDPDTGELGPQEVVLDGIPAGRVHNGGRIAFGPDGMLYAGTGDAQDADLAQDRDSLAGKILRMTPDGRVPDDNPFDNHVYSYGHRNVQGLAWDDEERLFGVEFGAADWDEVNLIEPGGNYGWPAIEGPGGDDPYTDPFVAWTPEEASPSGAAFAGGALWVAALRGERLWRVPLDGGDPVAYFTGDYGRLRTVEAAPEADGLWLTTSNRDGRGTPGEDDDRVVWVPLA